MSQNNQIESPSLQQISKYLRVRNRQPPAFSSGLAACFGLLAFCYTLHWTFFVASNPVGNARRMQYENSLPLHWRFLKKSGPVWVFMTGLYAMDKYNGVWD